MPEAPSGALVLLPSPLATPASGLFHGCVMEEGTGAKKPPGLRRAVFGKEPGLNYFSFISLYSTCLRALGSNFMISIFSGIVFLFLVVV